MKSLIQKISNLSEQNKSIFERIFEINIEKTKLFLPENLKIKYQEAEEQEIFVVRNKILNQETHFNIWRAKRKEPKNKSNLLKEDYDPFCDVINNTPFDEFGRLENESAITASNLAKSAKNHSLIIFKKHKFNLIDIENAFLLAQEWFSRFNEDFKIIIWNYGYRSGASIFHPHLQIFALDYLPLKLTYFFNQVENYQLKYQSNYFDDLFSVAAELNLAKSLNNFKIIINLTPFKDDEIIFFFKSNLKDNIKTLSKLIYFYLKIGIENFNFFLIEKTNFFLGFLVNRGDSEKINSDIGALEIYSFSVVGSNPFDLAEKLFNIDWS